MNTGFVFVCVGSGIIYLAARKSEPFILDNSETTYTFKQIYKYISELTF
jgi:hypothetical protein